MMSHCKIYGLLSGQRANPQRCSGYAKRQECFERELVINIQQQQQQQQLVLFNVNLICVCVLTAAPLKATCEGG